MHEAILFDWTAFWAALAALGQCIEAGIVTLTAIALYFQVKRWREASSSHRVAAIDWLLHFLKSDRFEDNVRAFMQGDFRSEKAALLPLNALALVLADYDLVADLISSHYVDKLTVFKLGAGTMETILDKVNAIRGAAPVRGRVSRVLAYRPRVLSLLAGAKAWMEKVRAEASAHAESIP